MKNEMSARSVEITLVILDYSGTLSMEAVRFGEPENLKRALKESGLWNLGINNLEFFWKKIINPTWQKGSTTQKGYANIITESLKKIRFGSTEIDEEMNEQIYKSAELFTQKYFDGSKFQPEWEKLLNKITNNSQTCVVMATDNYAEATHHIKNELKKLGVESRTVSEAESKSEITSLAWIANSADLGTHKNKPEFWTKVKTVLLLNDVSNILIIDDFGVNEVAGDIYSTREKVEKRKSQTTQLLEDVFNITPKIFTFDLRAKMNRSAFNTLIDEAVEFIEKNTIVD